MMDSADKYNYHLHKTIIYSVIGVMTFLGFFGNLNIIVVHFRKSTLRTKYGILLCSLSIFQTICLLYEWIGVLYTITATTVYRSTCFHLLFPYVFCHCMQTGILTTISFDLLISILKPVWHRSQDHYPYCAKICIPALIFAISTVTLGFVFLNNDALKMCNPPSSLHSVSNEFFYFGALVAGAIVIVNYLAVYILIFYKSQKDRHPLEMERRAMKSLSVILLVFVFTRYIGVLTSNLLIFIGSDPALISLYQSYNVIFAYALYGQNFYVSYWRSSEYRSHLKEQIVLGLLRCFPKSGFLQSQMPHMHLFTTVRSEKTGTK